MILFTHHPQQMNNNFITTDIFLQLMSIETEAGAKTHDSSSDTIGLRLRQEPEMDSREIEFSTGETTLRLVDERIKQAIDQFLWQLEGFCAPLASRTELESAGNSEATGSSVKMRPLAPRVIGTTILLDENKGDRTRKLFFKLSKELEVSHRKRKF